MATQAPYIFARVTTDKGSMPRVSVIEQVLALRALHPDTKPIAHDGAGADAYDDQGNESSDVNKQQQRDRERKRNNRNSTSALLPDVHTVFQQSESATSRSPRSSVRYRPASIIGIVHPGALEFPLLKPGKQEETPKHFCDSFPFAPLFCALPLGFKDSTPDPEEKIGMTPSNEKKPLPSSKSTTFPGQPTSYAQWRASLQQVKVMFVKSRYRECADHCNRLLDEAKVPPQPAHESYLHFYCALSNELIAQAAHNLSVTKLPLLVSAKESYEAASASLPNPSQSLLLFHYDDDIDDEYPLSDSVSAPNSPRAPTTPTPRQRNQPKVPPSSPLSVEMSPDDNVRKPSPLRIRKALPTLSTADSPITPPPSPSPKPSIAFTTAASSWLKSRSQERYSTHLIAFAGMLENHVITINNLIETTQETQAQRYSVKRLASYGGDGAAKEADKREKIKRLKESGWKRERFQPGKYQDLCAKALAEL